eukprot:7715318-Pyramimonas_sp.AAC.1
MQPVQYLRRPGFLVRRALRYAFHCGLANSKVSEQLVVARPVPVLHPLARGIEEVRINGPELGHPTRSRGRTAL